MAFEKKTNIDNKKNALRVMPNSYEAEQAILGAILSDVEIAYEVVSELAVVDFYTTAHKTIFEEILNLKSSGKPVDIIMLSSSLSHKGLLSEVGGVTMLSELTESIPSVANVKYYLNIVKQKSLLRKIIRTGNEIIANAYDMEDSDKALSFAEAKIFEISQDNGEKSSLRPLADVALDVLNQYSDVYQTRQPKTGLMVGLSNLDELTNGFLPGQMIVIAARPGCGKTSFCMQIISNICKYQQEKVVACFNLEMSDTELAQRIIANVTQTPSSKFVMGDVNQEELDKMWASSAVFDKSKVYIDDSAQITAEQIMSKCRKLKMQKGRLDLVIIDYLQLMDSMKSNESKQQQVSDTSRAIKILAKELGVPVLLLSQMSRKIEGRDDKTPMLADLRESGAIEQDADMVMFLYAGDFELFNEEGTPIYLKVAKNRNGSVADLAYRWNKATMSYAPVRNIVIKAVDENGNTKGNGGAGSQNTANESQTSFVDNSRDSQAEDMDIHTNNYADDNLENIPIADMHDYDDPLAEIQNSDFSIKPKTTE